ncbi:MAG: GH3 auxin-responsive promoter family protein [Myxococcota bacterium]|nr:GH3 auxin-responsive promoter family protein [Myxococcota bacterium]
MLLLTQIAHRAATMFSRKEYLAYIAGLKDIAPHQRDVLGQILNAVSGTASAEKHGLSGAETPDTFREKVPLSEYADWGEMIERQRQTGQPVLSKSPCERYQPTSGSTSKIKWIPYTKQFLAQVDAFISPLIYHMYLKYPKIRKGTHYWSLSWVPTELRKKVNPNVNDDLKLLPWWKSAFMSITMAVPSNVAQAETSDDSIFSTACYLCADQHLSFISVWSPTFLLNLLDFISAHREEIAEVLATGQWISARESLDFIPCPKSHQAARTLSAWDGTIEPKILKRLWPAMGMISAWDTWTSEPWAKELRMLFPFAAFEGKGLLATEGIVTMPFDGEYPLTYQCHFYEFKDLSTNDILYPWELEKGQVVQPILTTGAGLLRYALHDRLEVTGFLETCPCFRFVGRSDGIDLVGEKMSPEIASQLLAEIGEKYPVKPLSLIAIPKQYSGMADRYLLLCDGNDTSFIDDLAADVEAALRKTFHYNLARDLNQLAHPACVVSPEAKALYQSRASARGMVAGNLKIEPVVLWNCDLPLVFQGALGDIERNVS